MADNKLDKQAKIIYKKFKRYLLPLAFFVSSIVIIMQVLLPQIDSVRDIRDQMESQKTDVKLAESSLSVLSVVDDQKLESDFSLATIALPTEKDISLMFQVLSNAATKSDTVLGGFSIKVGNVFNREDNQSSERKTIDGIPFLNIVVKISGSEKGLINFAKDLYASIPVVELNSVRVANNEGTYDINYYFKQINLKAISQTTRVTALTPEEQQLLDTLSEWE